jgi:hypothetical protein
MLAALRTTLQLRVALADRVSGRGRNVCDINVYKRGDISMVLMCDALDVIGYDRRRLEISNALL